MAGQTQPGSCERNKTVTTCEEIYLEEKTRIETFRLIWAKCGLFGVIF